jgi:hypothetical protein
MSAQRLSIAGIGSDDETDTLKDKVWILLPGIVCGADD